jgi:hypothetical protein
MSPVLKSNSKAYPLQLISVSSCDSSSDLGFERNSSGIILAYCFSLQQCINSARIDLFMKKRGYMGCDTI